MTDQPVDQIPDPEYPEPSLDILNKRLAKQNRKLVERLNRISNLCIGNQRVWKLNEVVTTLKTDAVLALEDGEKEVAQHLVALALYVERLEYDLGKLRLAIRDEQPRNVARVDYVAGKYDPENWRGPRP